MKFTADIETKAMQCQCALSGLIKSDVVCNVKTGRNAQTCIVIISLGCFLFVNVILCVRNMYVFLCLLKKLVQVSTLISVFQFSLVQ